MKTLKIMLMLLLPVPALQAQNIEAGTTLTFSQPGGMMSKNMNNAFGLSFELTKKFQTPFSAGVELGIGNYGYQTSRQTYTFDDGSETETDVNVSNNIFNLLLTGKHFLRENKNLNPYLSGKAGWTWFSTNLTIEDPADQYSCHPIDSEILSRDNTYLFSGGAGLRIDLKTFSRHARSQRIFFDLGIHATHGGIVKYMNVEKNGSQPIPDGDVMVKFLNTQTLAVHEHHVGYVYRSVLNMVEYRFGLVFRPAFDSQVRGNLEN